MRDCRSALMSGDIPPPEDEDAGRKMTSPWRNGKSYLFKGPFLLRGVSAPSCIKVCFSQTSVHIFSAFHDPGMVCSR